MLRLIGIGEYVEDPKSISDSWSSTESENFSVSSNAVVVNIATPEAIADAVLFLVGNESLRHLIGRNGRRTVTSYFTVERQMNQYASLYNRLIEEKKCMRKVWNSNIKSFNKLSFNLMAPNYFLPRMFWIESIDTAYVVRKHMYSLAAERGLRTKDFICRSAATCLDDLSDLM